MTPEGWQRLALRDLGEIIKARGGTKKDQTEDGVPVIRYGELYTKHDAIIRRFFSFVPREKAAAYTELRKGDVLFAGSGETLEDIGRSAAFIGPEPALASGDLILLRPRPGFHSGFLGYATNGPEAVAHKRRVGQGSSVFHIHADELGSMLLSLPPPREQKKIAAILSSVDDAIESTQAVIDQLGVVKKAMMAELLTRGLPGRHTSFKQTEIGEVPEEWEPTSLGALASFVTSGSRGWAEYYSEEGALFVRSQNVRAGVVDLSDSAFVKPPANAEGARTRLQARDILITITGNSVGNVAVSPDGLGEAYVSQHVGLVRLRDPSIAFYCALFLAPGAPGNEQVLAAQYGQSKPGLNLKNLRNFRIALPPVRELEAIEASIGGVQSRIQAESDACAALRDLKAALMSALLTGEVRVKPDEDAA